MPVMEWRFPSLHCNVIHCMCYHQFHNALLLSSLLCHYLISPPDLLFVTLISEGLSMFSASLNLLIKQKNPNPPLPEQGFLLSILVKEETQHLAAAPSNIWTNSWTLGDCWNQKEEICMRENWVKSEQRGTKTPFHFTILGEVVFQDN